MPQRSRSRRSQVGETRRLRIIGGQWRGRRFSFTPQEGLRPTTDRIRETLFNWLAADILDARCLDLFCGSGALGLEALSRGAAHCDFVDNNALTIKLITGHLEVLGATRKGACHLTSADRFLASPSRGPWDLVFIDPPFSSGLGGQACQQLESQRLLSAGARIYLETALQDANTVCPDSWQLFRDKSAGGVRYRLFQRP